MQSFNLPGIFPSILKSLTIGHNAYAWDQYGHPEAIQPNILPPSLNHLEANWLFENHPIGLNVLPYLLETLRFRKTDDHIFIIYSLCNFPLYPGVLPSSLKVLELSGDFNHPIARMCFLNH